MARIVPLTPQYKQLNSQADREPLYIELQEEGQAWFHKINAGTFAMAVTIICTIIIYIELH